jgi:catechol 2,3-dioxygenase-like lactoylglutathione lyase family enzyme
MTTAPFSGPVRQFAYVVHDLDAAIASWLELRVGPWFVLRDFRVTGGEYRGAPAEPVLSMAFANSGEIQLELISPVGQAPSIYREFLGAGQEGFHHIAYWTRDYDRDHARALGCGWECVQYGPVRYAYYETSPGLHGLVELTEVNDRLEGFTDAIRAAAATWDGVSEPVRSYPPV